ncbi:ISAzo13-like element transposase-related protein [Bathymodiolus platifrons methanotrophic gill symbiont]|uniref:ISAzo13-like element transposase-related protein n=1 Tax=Bathymodiolus platifrons methanotrophic gill symbiont TaxID=113268 RepID=UPI001E5D3239|nr:hypothetical protein [Bathymodiolus platifrons methanotrophic gill symbiont]
MAASNGSTAIRDKILASLARYRALRIGKFPCAFWRLSSRPGLTANALGLEIRIAHYPPYTSKYNPIEHRFFPHVTRACEGVVFDSVETVKTLISRTSTSKGLTTIVHILDKIYETGRKYAADFKEIMPIVFDTHLPKWNYRAIPQE